MDRPLPKSLFFFDYFFDTRDSKVLISIIEIERERYFSFYSLPVYEEAKNSRMVNAANALNIANNLAFKPEEAAVNKAEGNTGDLSAKQKDLELKAIGIMRSLSAYPINPELRGDIYLAITTNPEACEAVAALIRNNRNGDAKVISEIKECLARSREVAEPTSYEAQNFRNAINNPAYSTPFRAGPGPSLVKIAAQR